jgi:hypothetical protein
MSMMQSQETKHKARKAVPCVAVLNSWKEEKIYIISKYDFLPYFQRPTTKNRETIWPRKDQL